MIGCVWISWSPSQKVSIILSLTSGFVGNSGARQHLDARRENHVHQENSDEIYYITNSDYWADFCPTWDDFWLGWFYGCPEMVDNWGWFIIVGPTLIIFKDKLGCKILPSTGDAKFLLGQPHASLARIPSAANAPGWAGHGDHQPAPKGTYHRKPEVWKTKLWPKKCWLQNSQTFQRRTQIKKLRRILKNPWNILRWNIHIKPDSTFRNTKSFHSMSLSNR